MSMEPPDPKLSAEFAELRRRDAEKAPAFETMWRPRARRVSAWWVAAPAATFVAAAAAAVLWIGSAAMRRAEPPPAAGAAVVAKPSEPELRVAMDPDPLGFLLEQPSISSVPDFDSVPVRRP